MTTLLGDSIAVEIRAEDPLALSTIASVLSPSAGRSKMEPPDASCVIVGTPAIDRDVLGAIDLAAKACDHVIVVCAASRPSTIRSAVARGAAGVVAADHMAILPLTLATVARGQVCVPAESSGAVTRPALTFREKQVLTLVAGGRTNAQIASSLYLAESTVKTHLSSVFDKLGVHSRSEAAQLILDPELGRCFGLSTPAPSPA